MKAYFSEGKDVSDKKILEQALLDVGLNAEEALSRLNDDETIKEMRTKQDYWKNLGVNSVPTFVFNKKEGITGAHPISTFKNVLNQML